MICGWIQLCILRSLILLCHVKTAQQKAYFWFVKNLCSRKATPPGPRDLLRLCGRTKSVSSYCAISAFLFIISAYYKMHFINPALLCLQYNNPPTNLVVFQMTCSFHGSLRFDYRTVKRANEIFSHVVLLIVHCFLYIMFSAKTLFWI